jgi:hypothetical protein
MKKKSKLIYKIIAVLAFIVLVCFLLMIPPVADTVAGWTGIASSKIRSAAMTIAGTAVGLLVMSFGVTALAAAPIVGIVLLAVGLALAVYSLWPLFSTGGSIPISQPGNVNSLGAGPILP